MRRIFSSVILFSFLFIVFSATTPAQGKLGVVGKTFKKVEADILFGTNISQVIVVPKSDILNAIKNAGDYVYFTVKNKRVYVLDEKKIAYYDKTLKIGTDHVAYIFSTSVLKKFINNVKGTYLTFELRGTANTPALKGGAFASGGANETLTITGDGETLEMAIPCPPICLEP